MFVGLSVEFRQCLPHHHQLPLTVTLENLGVALAEHLGDKVVRNPARAQPCSERVPQVIQRKVGTRARFRVFAQIFGSDVMCGRLALGLDVGNRYSESPAKCIWALNAT